MRVAQRHRFGLIDAAVPASANGEAMLLANDRNSIDVTHTCLYLQHPLLAPSPSSVQAAKRAEYAPAEPVPLTPESLGARMLSDIDGLDIGRLRQLSSKRVAASVFGPREGLGWRGRTTPQALWHESKKGHGVALCKVEWARWVRGDVMIVRGRGRLDYDCIRVIIK